MLDNVRSRVEETISKIKRAAYQVAGFSFVINLLLLVSPLYMLQVYDRVLSSGSRDTLIVLTGIAFFLLGLLAFLETIRTKLLGRAAAQMDRETKEDIFDGVIDEATGPTNGKGGQAIRDLDTVRQFISSNAPFAFFDAPWTPFFILVVAIMHPLLGLAALIGTIVIFALAVATELVSREAMQKAGGHTLEAQIFVEASLRNRDVLQSMNIADGLKKKWAAQRDPAIAMQLHANDRIGLLLGSIKATRIAIQIIILGLGGWLALDQAITPGVIVAASIITGRALAPVEQAVGTWRQVVSAKASFKRLRAMLAKRGIDQTPMALPRPEGGLSVVGLIGALPGAKEPVLKGVGFEVEAGGVLGLIGPSGAGKSFLARHLIGIQAPVRGTVRLGGVDVATWAAKDRGEYIGYLPQSVELFRGSVSENIARFGEIDADKVVAASKLAGCHELILQLPNNYDTVIGEGGVFLSGGQSQRVALARALYNNPVMVVLDEPNSNLDTAGELALARCLTELKAIGITTVVISHNIKLLQTADKILALQDGSVGAFGQKEEILRQFVRPIENTAKQAEA